MDAYGLSPLFSGTGDSPQIDYVSFNDVGVLEDGHRVRVGLADAPDVTLPRRRDVASAGTRSW
jgi:hypothetical protein